MNFQTIQDEPHDNEAEESADVIEDADSSEVEEPKKPQLSKETLGLLGVLLACGGVVAFMYMRNGPQSASAATTGSGNIAVVDQFLGNGDEHVKIMRQALQNTDKVVQEFRRYPSRPQVPLSDLSTNPFRQTTMVAGAPVTETDSTARRRREQERADAMKGAESLQLQSVLQGPHNACLINNTLVEQGQQVDGFTIEQIGPDSVIIRKGTFRFELRMGK